MLWIWRFNASLAALGINPASIPPHLRELGQQGKKVGATPQDAVVVLLSELPVELIEPMNPLGLRVWVKEGKLNVWNPTIYMAIKRIEQRLGCGKIVPDLPPTQS
jgi:hypothetical protein